MLQIDHLSKSYHAPVLNDLSFTVETGEIVCLLGASGCGKTTLLRLIAGLEMADSGRIIFDQHNLTHVPPHQRDFGLMFQEFALFPHMNVYQNVAFGLKMKRASAIETQVQAMLNLVGLAGFGGRDVNSLSGGERQRVALARSLAPDPRLLMLDEPLGALDRSLRERLMLEIRAILKRVGLTAIYVTHDQTEAFAVADRIIVLQQGQIEQIATPEQLYHQPATPLVAQFLGFTNIVEAVCLSANTLETPFGIWHLPAGNGLIGHKLKLLIRPEAASLEARSDMGLSGQVVSTLFRGRFYQLALATNGQILTFELGLAEPPPLGSQITLWLEPTAIMLFQGARSNFGANLPRYMTK